MIEMIKAVIFDMDGTLVHSEMLWFESAQKILAKYGASLTLSEYHKWVGKNEAGLLHAKAKKKGCRLSRNVLSDKRVEIAVKMLKNYPLKADRHLVSLMRAFRKRGMKTGLATGTRRSITLRFLKILGLEKEFDCIITSTDVKRRKPNPETYLKCARCLRLKPAECLVFEDSEPGVASAKNAGMPCIAVPTPLSMRHDFSRADIVVRNRAKLGINLLRRWIK